MKRFAVLVLFLYGCSSGFTLDQCITECSKCPDIPCEDLCGQLDIGIHSNACNIVSENMWSCALEYGCNFPDNCNEEINEFLECEP